MNSIPFYLCVGIFLIFGQKPAGVACLIIAILNILTICLGD